MLGRAKPSRQHICLNYPCDRRGRIEPWSRVAAQRACAECGAAMWEPLRAGGVRYFGWLVVGRADTLGNWWSALIHPVTGRIQAIIKATDAMKAGEKARKLVDMLRENEEDQLSGLRAS